MTGIEAITKIGPLMIDLIKHVKDGKTAALVQQIQSLHQIIMSENQQLHTENAKLIAESEKHHSQNITGISPRLRFEAPFYYADGDKSPFCPSCWDGKRKAVHLNPPVIVIPGPRYDCPVCNNSIIHPRKPDSDLGSGFIGR